MTDAQAIHELAQAGLAESVADESFDRFARLVRRQLGVPSALVTLVLDDGAVLPGALGLPEPYQSERRTPLSHTFCQFVTSDARPLVVEDARVVPHLASLRAVDDIGVVSYAGFPIFDPHGRAVGSLCAFDGRPRPWSDEDLATLADLASACTSELRLRLARARAKRMQRVALAANRRSRLLLELLRVVRRRDVGARRRRAALRGRGRDRCPLRGPRDARRERQPPRVHDSRPPGAGGPRVVPPDAGRRRPRRRDRRPHARAAVLPRPRPVRRAAARGGGAHRVRRRRGPRVPARPRGRAAARRRHPGLGGGARVRRRRGPDEDRDRLVRRARARPRPAPGGAAPRRDDAPGRDAHRAPVGAQRGASPPPTPPRPGPTRSAATGTTPSCSTTTRASS